MRGLAKAASLREKKKLAPRNFRSQARSAAVCAIVDFPIPATPFSQNTGGVLGSEFSAHLSISSRIASRVPSKQICRA